MSTKSLDTITAIATPAGRGGIGVVRISGSYAKSIGEMIIRDQGSGIGERCLRPRVARFEKFYDKNNQLIDEGIVLFFENPHSFTGEDVIELQSHGSPVVLDQLIQTAIHYGARMARPGEFSERAFLNKKMDLAQVEAIADLINASSTHAARSAVRSLQGEFSKKIHALQKSLTHLRMQIEAMIDFPDEEIDFLADPAVHTFLQQTIDDVLSVKNAAKQGAILQSGLQVVIAGKPNAGKSSLLNYLSGRESAIVTAIPGTTRDILRETIHLDGMPLHIIDTAGLRETDDVVEQEGVRRARKQIEQADLILMVVDATEWGSGIEDQGSIESMCPNIGNGSESDRLLIIRNKIDLTNEKPSLNNNTISLSIKTNNGTDLLINAIKQFAGFQSEEHDGFIARRRHVDAIERAYQFLLHGQTQLTKNRAGELLAEDLRLSQLALSEITGEFTSDDLLGEIFSSFCIGK